MAQPNATHAASHFVPIFRESVVFRPKFEFYNVNAPRAGKDYQEYQSSSKIPKALPGMYQNL